MGFTDNCDIFCSFHEDGFNRIIYHVMRQRPSLFNYATAYVIQRPWLLCSAITCHPIVANRSNPQLTVIDPLPIPGTNYGVNFAAQIEDLRIDFHPGDKIVLPPELSPPLTEQRLAIGLRVCGGIGCPGRKEGFDYAATIARGDDLKTKGIVALPTDRLNCFCLDAFATGGMRISDYHGKPYMEPFIEGFEIVDIKPDGLENSLECYIGLMLRLAILPGLRILLKRAPLNLTQGATDLFPQTTNVQLSPTAVSGALQNNPAIEKNELKAFITAEVV